jgi:hypothetical protein
MVLMLGAGREKINGFVGHVKVFLYSITLHDPQILKETISRMRGVKTIVGRAWRVQRLVESLMTSRKGSGIPQEER